MAKAYGAMEVELDLPKLQQDIADGKLSSLEVLPPQDLQTMIAVDINRINPSINIDEAVARGRAGIDEYLADLNLSKSQTGKLGRRLVAYYNTTRDGEYLIKGIIPREYLKGPTPTGGGTSP